jgi:hypothetical protein
MHCLDNLNHCRQIWLHLLGTDGSQIHRWKVERVEPTLCTVRTLLELHPDPLPVGVAVCRRSCCRAEATRRPARCRQHHIRYVPKHLQYGYFSDSKTPIYSHYNSADKSIRRKALPVRMTNNLVGTGEGFFGDPIGIACIVWILRDCVSGSCDHLLSPRRHGAMKANSLSCSAPAHFLRTDGDDLTVL